MCGSCSNTYCSECGKPVYMRNCEHCKQIDDNEDEKSYGATQAEAQTDTDQL